MATITACAAVADELLRVAQHITTLPEPFSFGGRDTVELYMREFHELTEWAAYYLADVHFTERGHKFRWVVAWVEFVHDGVHVKALTHTTPTVLAALLISLGRSGDTTPTVIPIAELLGLDEEVPA